MKISLKNIPVSEIIPFFTEKYGDFSVKLTNYSLVINAGGNKYFFSTTPMSKKTFIFYSMMRAEIGGEIREVNNKTVSYYDFSGKRNIRENMFCVDLNSAYLQSVLNEGLISENTFNYVNSVGSKVQRLQSVGMFASYPIILEFEKGALKRFDAKRNELNHVFFNAVKHVSNIMNCVKNAMPENFCFYWVDGIFLNDNPERAVQIFEELGFRSKIEVITEFQVKGNYYTFRKDGEPKILFFPKTKKKEKDYFLNLVSKYKEI